MSSTRQKTILAAMTLTASLLANASFFQESCSNSEGTLLFVTGHLNNSVTVTEFVPGGNQKIEFDLYDMEVEFTLEKEIEVKNYSSCIPGKPGPGYSKSTRVSTTLMTVSKKDGSLFPGQTAVQVSDDRRSVQDHVICRFNASSQVLCE